jgi:hypothetical protein
MHEFVFDTNWWCHAADLLDGHAGHGLLLDSDEHIPDVNHPATRCRSSFQETACGCGVYGLGFVVIIGRYSMRCSAL